MKLLAKIFGALIALIIVAALAAPMFINQETLKAQLVAQVKKATGRTLSIKGATSVTFLPNIAVTAEDVTLSNPEGFTSPYFVSLKKLETGAELRPLLRGELIVNGITLDGASTNLEETKGGTKNWEFTKDKLQDSAEQVADAPEAQENSKGAIKRFALGDITISDSAINILKPGAQVMAIQDIDLTLKGADANSPLELDGSAEYRGERVTLALDIKDTRDFLDNKFSPLEASLALPGATANFKGEARMGDSMGARGKLSANSAALPKVLTWLSGKQASPSTPNQVALDAAVDYAGTTAKLSDASLRVDEAKATGALTIDHGGAVPSIAGNLNFSELNLDAFASKGGSTQSSVNNGAPKSDAWSSKPVDLSALKSVNADLALVWEKLVSGKFIVGPSKAKLTINNGKLALNIAQAALYNGALRGTVRASNGGIAADLKGSGIDIEALMEALSGKSRLEGKTNLALNITASGNSQQSWVNSLNGSGALKVVDGALKGINIGKFLRDAKQGFLFKSEAESTDFSELSGSYTIKGGVLSNSDLAMKSPALRLTGSGSANLPSKTLNYRLVPTIAGTSKGQGGKDDVGGITIPLSITGPWSNPSVAPDLAGMVEEGLKNPETIKQNIQGIKDSWGDLNSTDDLKRVLLGGEKKPAAAPAPTTTAPATTEPAVAPAAKSEKEQRQEKIQEGIGSLLKGF